MDATVLERGRCVDPAELDRRADRIRLDTIRLIDKAGLGHYSSTFSCAEILAALYYHALRLAPTRPNWPDRDRFLLGKGHAATGLWPVLADLGYFEAAWLDRFAQLGAELTDHPNMRAVPGIDFSSGSLGHNLSVGVGMALAARFQGRDFRTIVLTGDGEIQEGQVWEAAMAASHYELGSLVAIVDANGYAGGGATSAAMNIEPIAGRFEAFGWAAVEVDGHDVKELVRIFDELPPTSSKRPTGVVARTRKGKGLASMEADPQRWHLGCMSAGDRDAAIAEIESRLS